MTQDRIAYLEGVIKQFSESLYGTSYVIWEDDGVYSLERDHKNSPWWGRGNSPAAAVYAAYDAGFLGHDPDDAPIVNGPDYKALHLQMCKRHEHALNKLNASKDEVRQLEDRNQKMTAVLQTIADSKLRHEYESAGALPAWVNEMQLLARDALEKVKGVQP